VSIFPFPLGDVFIETGLGHGQTAEAALKEPTVPYQVVHSIDVNAWLIQKAYQRFGIHDARMHFHHGSSVDILPRLCNPQLQTVFWLDAHYSYGAFTNDKKADRAQLDPVHGECPLLAELAIIRAVPWRQAPVILIDDVAFFETADYSDTFFKGLTREHWPWPKDIEGALPAGYQLTIAGDGRYYRAVQG
jgi:hypothetical protein